MSLRGLFVLLALLGGSIVAGLVYLDESGPESPPQPTRAVRARATCDGLPLDELLFPRDLIHPMDSRADDNARRVELPYFAAMGEPSLSCGPVTGEIFRFSQFERGGAPTTVRIARLTDGTVKASISQLEAPWWKGPGRPIIRDTKRLTETDWNRLKVAAVSARFWELIPYEHRGGEDGSDWFVEARRGPSYHVVLRISPPDGPFRQLGELMLALARPPLPEAERSTQLFWNPPNGARAGRR